MTARRGEPVLDRLLRSLPDERHRLLPYVRRAEAYRTECGCRMGGVFLAAALGFCVFTLMLRGFPTAHLAGVLLRGLALIFGAGIAGKLTGIALARLRLALLYRRLRLRFAPEGE